MNDHRGSTMAMVLITTVLLSSLALAFASQFESTMQLQERSLGQDRAAYYARAGVERMCTEVLDDLGTWASISPGPYFDTIPFAQGTYSAELLASDATTAVILATGSYQRAQRRLRFQLVNDGTRVTIARVDDLFLESWLGGS